MAKTTYGLTERKIAKRIDEGRGNGSGSDYKPWLYVNDVPSSGRSHRMYSRLTGRIHHFLSDLEFYTFLLLENDPTVNDVREQFPLNREDTVSIALENGIRHPSYQGVNQVMSSDFMVDSVDKEKPKYVIQAKYVTDLLDARVVEKLEIEYLYWKQKSIPWYIITERQIDDNLKSNAEWLLEFNDHDCLLDEEDMKVHIMAIRNFFRKVPELKVQNACMQFDHVYGLEPGESLRTLRLYCSGRKVTFNILKNFNILKVKDFSFDGLEGEFRNENIAG